MNTRFPFVVGITLCANATDPYVITGATTFSDDPNAATGYVDGVEYHVFVRLPDNATNKYEEVWGMYTASTDSIARTRVGKSSAGYGIKVNWGSSAPKHIAAVVSGEELGNMASIFIDLKPWEDILVGGTMQSNGGKTLVYVGSAPADTALVDDWSRAVPGTGGNDWRKVVKAEQYTDYNDALPYIGTVRSVNAGGWKACGSVIHAFCTRLAQFTGRKVRSISVHRGATSFADPANGWLYDPTVSTSVITVFIAAVNAAIARMHVVDPIQSSITKLHIYMMLHGENDAAGGEAGQGTPLWTSPSNVYGDLVAEHIVMLEDPARGNICDSKTLYLLHDIPTPMREIKSYQVNGANEFDGHAQAQALIGGRCRVLPTLGIKTLDDQIHYTGEEADKLGYQDADLLLANARADNDTGGAMRLSKVNTWYDATAIWTWETNSASLPSAAGRWRFNVAENVVTIRKTDGIPVDRFAQGLGQFEVGDLLRLANAITSPTVYVDFRITGAPTITTDNVAYPCAVVTSVGTRTAVVFYLQPQNTAWHDGKSFLASTPHALQSRKQALINTETVYTGGVALTADADLGKDFHILMGNANGAQSRTRKAGPRWGALRTTNATGVIILDTNHMLDGVVEYVKATVSYKVPANGNVGVFELHGIIRRTGTTTSADWAPAATVLIDEEALATDPVLAALTFFGIGEGWKITVTGKAATSIDWVCLAEIIDIPTSP